MIDIFAHAEMPVTRSQVSDWLKKEDDPDRQACNDKNLASFLNGLIIELRGKKDGAIPKAETTLNNNIIFTKLKIALNLKAEDILEIMEIAEFVISKHELSALFRRPGHKHYRECKDQFLRNFLRGIQQVQRPDTVTKFESAWPGKRGSKES